MCIISSITPLYYNRLVNFQRSRPSPLLRLPTVSTRLIYPPCQYRTHTSDSTSTTPSTPPDTPPPPPPPTPPKRPRNNPKNHSNHTLPPRPTLPTTELKHTYLKGSGPGGQKINKTSSAVQITHIPTGIVVKSQATRSRRQNHDIARRLLAEKVEVLEKGKESRVEKVRELKGKRQGSADKKKRRKYRRLAEEKAREEEGEEYGGGEVEGDEKR